jgi:hypothetical protein
VTRIKFAAPGLAAAILLSLAPANAATTTHDKDYLPGNSAYGMCDIEPIVPGVPDSPAWGVNIGAVCLPVTNNVQDARIERIIDTASESVGYFWIWLDEDWNEVGGSGLTEDPADHLLGSTENHGFGCARATASPWLPKPPGAKYFYVHVDTAVTGALDCGPGEGGATVGTVTLKLRT